MNFSNRMSKVISHKSKLDNTKKDLADNMLKIERYNGEIAVVNEMFKTSELCYEYLNRLVNVESGKFVLKLQELISLGLKTIFYDKDYACDIRMSDTSASIHLIYTDENGNVISPNVRDGIGGGVRTVVGFLSQIFFINHYRAEKLVFIDEGFSAISDDYMTYFISFIKELSEVQGFKVLLITHDERLVNLADRVYGIDKGKSTLIKGDEEVIQEGVN